MTTRRKFLASCSTITLAATVAPGTVLAAPVPLDQLSLANFAAQVHTNFDLHRPSARRVPLELVQVQRQHASHPMALKAPDAANEKFSLLFRGPLDKPLTQDTYNFEHEQMGRFAMFIVPVSTKKTGKSSLYQAVFNRRARNSVQAS